MMNAKARQLVIYLAALLSPLAQDVFGTTLTVTNTNDSFAGSLRQEILDANAGDTVVFNIPTSDPGYNPADGTYTISLDTSVNSSGDITINKSLTIAGPGANVLTVHRNDTPFFQVFRVTGGNVVISGLTIRDGDAGSGGNISNSANLTLRDCVIANGTSDTGGGVNNSGTLLLERDTISGNMAGDAGGINNTGIASIVNCTITNNQGSNGGGIRQFAGTLTITNCTVFGNKSDTNGSGIFQAGGTANVRNCIIVGNTGGGGDEVSGSFASQGHNVIGQGMGIGHTACCFNSAGDQIDVTAAQVKLGPLQLYGGTTPTFALLPGSVAIDAGDDSVLSVPLSLTTDQRGLPRKLGAHVDAGAFEFDPPQTGTTFVVTTTDQHDDAVCGTLDCTLLEALNAANASADSNIINFKPGLRGTILNSFVQGLVINQPVTINGPGARALAITGNDLARVFNVQGGPVVISGLTITHGRAVGANQTGIGSSATDGNGGGITGIDNLTLNDCILAGNSSRGGAGFFGGGASGNGGAIYNEGTLALNRCTLSGNSTTGGAGGFQGANGGGGRGGAINNTGTLNLTNCSLSGNSALGGRGGSDQSGSPGNGGNGSGGGEYNAGTLTLTNCTFSGNNAAGGTAGTGGGGFGFGGVGSGGGLFQSSGSAAVRNTIISSNTANTSNPDVAGSLSSIDHNLIGGNEPLGPLTDNGGRTDTMALLAGSAAINGGNDAIAPKLDQRGYLRGGISDIGAFESGGQPLRITSITHPDSTHILLQGVGVPNALHTVQVSVDPNGTNFGALTSIMTNGSGQWQYNDTPSAGQTKLFYRLTFP